MGNRYSRAPKRGYKYFFSAGKIEVDSDTGCWIWLGSQFPDGYGRVNYRLGSAKWVPIRAQAYFWRIYRYEPKGMDVAHQCHRRLCVNMRHLTLQPHTENMQDMYRYPLDSIDQSKVRSLWQDGYDYTFIADSVMAPRIAVMRLLQQINLDQLEFPYAG